MTTFEREPYPRARHRRRPCHRRRPRLCRRRRHTSCAEVMLAMLPPRWRWRGLRGSLCGGLAAAVPHPILLHHLGDLLLFRRRSSNTVKVHIFWEGHKILRNLPHTFDYLQYIQSKVRGRFRKNVWASQNIWTLSTVNCIFKFSFCMYDPLHIYELFYFQY